MTATLAPATWVQHAACRGHADLMLNPAPRLRTRQQAMCASCPVFNECLAALELDDSCDAERAGFRAGLTERERGKIRRARRNRDAIILAGNVATLTRIGWSVNDIAARLDTTTRTVERHRQDLAS